MTPVNRVLRFSGLAVVLVVLCDPPPSQSDPAAQPNAAVRAEPAIVAHRGLLRHAPENTLPAYRACLELRLGFELDVQRSRDGHLVVIHDDTVDRTTDGTGKVSELTLAELKRLDAGSWFHPAFRGERVPTLDEVLALVAEYPDAKVLVAVDIKSTPSSSLPPQAGEGEGIEADLVRAVEEHGVGDRVVYIGRAIGDSDVRRRLREADAPASQLSTQKRGRARVGESACLANGPEELPSAIADPYSGWVYLRFLPTVGQVNSIHAAGKRVLIAGPLVAGLEPTNWRAAAEAGVDAVLTDYPLELRGEVRGVSRTVSAKETETPAERLSALVESDSTSALIHSQLGVTRREAPIPCLVSDDDLNYETPKTRILLVGGLDGSDASVQATLGALRWFYHADEAARLRARYALSAVPCANPDGWAAGAGPANGSGGDPSRGYPPEGNAYGSPTDPEAAYLWRWIGMHAPDLVVEVRAGESAAWRIVESDDAQLNRLAAALPSAERADASEELFCQLPLVAPSNVGTIPAVLVQVGGSASGEPLETLFEAIAKSAFRGPSPARRELQRRLDRSPLEVAEQLSKIYGHELDQVVYIPALALIGRLRLGELTKDPGPLADVERIVAPYRTGKKPALPSEPSGSDLAGHLVFGELARRTGEKAYLDLARAAADFGFDADGKPMNAMPFHLEMSDSVFMGGPILAQVGRLTGERRYFDLCARHLRFMRDVDLRPDGLYRHSPLDEAAWGRGNGFAALGVAMCLADFPDDHPDRPELVEQFRAHLAVLARHQDPTGTWHQVIDVPASYRELTATCMITFAMVRGIRLGVLDRAAYEPIVERAWYAIRTRVAPDGTLVDVCTGTGKQMSLRDYFDRTAILGPDARGGAMALMVATEMAEWEAEGR